MGNVDFGSDRLRLALMAIALFLGGYSAHSFMSGLDGAQRGVSPSALSMDAMAERTFNFVAERFLKPQGIDGALLGVDKYGDSLYQVNFSLQRGGLTQNASVLVTMDGKLILLGDGGNIVDIVEDGGSVNETRREERISSSEADDVSDAAYAFGVSNAPITIIEFNDYQCPFCKRFRDETFDSLRQLYSSQIRYVFMDFPIAAIHPQAFVAHVAARCAGDQRKYLEYHDKLFANQPVWSKFAPDSKEEVGELKKYAMEIGLNTTVFNQCLDSRQHADEVRSNMQKGVNAGVTATPTFFINGQKVEGAQPLSAFQELIAAQMK